MFPAVSSLSVHCKRLKKPELRSDDGWITVHYEGKPLAHYRCGAVGG